MKTSVSALVAFVLLFGVGASTALAWTPAQDSERQTYRQDGGTATTASSIPLSYQFRLGASLNHAAATPRFYGLGGGAEASLILNKRVALGMRADGIGMLGFGITEDVSVGARGLGGVLGKAEILLNNGGHTAPIVLEQRTRFVVGAASGIYRIGAIGGSVSRNISEEKKEGLSGIALGGRAFGIAPQLGMEKGRIRISTLTHLIFTRDDFDPVFSVELSFRLL